jgi:glycerate dehydrogenase
MMRISVLDAATLGEDLSLALFEKYGEVTVWGMTAPDEVESHLADAEVVILNKIKLNATNLANAKSLKLICITATGFDNVDVEYCRAHGIAVCNVVGYSTQCVAQLTVSMALSLITNLPEYNRFVCSGEYVTGRS